MTNDPASRSWPSLLCKGHIRDSYISGYPYVTPVIVAVQRGTITGRGALVHYAGCV